MDIEENRISKEILDACILIHRELGPGLLESVYEVLLEDELVRRGFRVTRQTEIPITWRGKRFIKGFEADLIIDEKVIIELKSVEKLHPVHFKQTLTYLRLLNLRLGLLINFGECYLKNGFHRVVNGLE